MEWNTNAIISRLMVLRSRCILHLSGEQGVGGSAELYSQDQCAPVVVGEGAGAHFTPLLDPSA